MYLLGINYDDIPNYNIINENFEHDNIQNYSHFKHIGKYPLTNKEEDEYCNMQNNDIL